VSKIIFQSLERLTPRIPHHQESRFLPINCPSTCENRNPRNTYRLMILLKMIHELTHK
jgi:hypothetical protein